MAEIHDYAVVVRWKNFRGFEDTGRLDLKPITILIGPNNAGKTSLFMPLLILSQTLFSHDSETTLITRGPLVDAGNFDNITHDHESPCEITFRLGLHVHEPDRNVKAVGKYPPGGAELVFRKKPNSEELEVARFEIFDIFERAYLTGKQTSEGLQVELTNLQTARMKPNESRAIQKCRPINFMYSPTAIIAGMDKDEPGERDRERSIIQFSREFSEYLSVVGATFQLFRGTLDNLSYIGPVRERLRRYYEKLGSKPDSVGPRGRQAPELFRGMDKAAQQAVSRWVKKFELGSSLKVVDDRGTGGIYSLMLGSANGQRSKYNVADTGFGVSQVLPLIIQAVAGAKGSITIAEQPEIHLNPRLQGVLADLFVEMANRGQRVIVETHSEHLVLRLRRLIAEGKISAKKVGLHFVERRDDRSFVREVPIDESGHIEGRHWPSGFFDEPLNESLALAQAQSRRRKREESKAKTQ